MNYCRSIGPIKGVLYGPATYFPHIMRINLITVGHKRRMITKDHILAEIRRTASNGTALGSRRFTDETGIKPSDWERFWTRWKDAVRDAGCIPSTMQEALSEEHLLESLASLIRELGQFPTSRDLRMKARNDPGFPSHNTFNRLGPKAERARRVVEFCASRNDFSDVADIATPFAASSPQAEAVGDN
jgi:hypothetical protein